jgi:hypothetical protein
MKYLTLLALFFIIVLMMIPEIFIKRSSPVIHSDTAATVVSLLGFRDETQRSSTSHSSA